MQNAAGWINMYMYIYVFEESSSVGLANKMQLNKTENGQFNYKRLIESQI